MVANEKSKRVSERAEARGVFHPRAPSFFPRLPGARRAAPPTEGLEQASSLSVCRSQYLSARDVFPIYEKSQKKV